MMCNLRSQQLLPWRHPLALTSVGKMISARKLCFFTISISFLLLLGLEVEAKTRDKNTTKAKLHREGKIFSLFNIVQFKNSECRSTASSGAGNRNGTCYTSAECESKGGSINGKCAAGFGVCCVFIITSASATTVTQNCTYIQNPGFPDAFTGNGVIYTINKQCPDVCYLRLDFETFSLFGVGSIETNGGQCVNDQFEIVASASNENIPIICGENTGQHVYVDMGHDVGSTITLDFAVNSAAAAQRSWDIKVTQLLCASRDAPPNGCLQYHRGLTGRLTTFNFNQPNDGHLANQQYSVCIRQEAGFCCIKYMVCPGTDGFSLSDSTALPVVTKALQDSTCILDYIAIPLSGATCDQTGNSMSFDDKYCGGYLNNVADAALKINAAVCDCTTPFIVDIFTDNIMDIVATNPVRPPRGICLEWMQVKCTG